MSSFHDISSKLSLIDGVVTSRRSSFVSSPKNLASSLMRRARDSFAITVDKPFLKNKMGQSIYSQVKSVALSKQPKEKRFEWWTSKVKYEPPVFADL